VFEGNRRGRAERMLDDEKVLRIAVMLDRESQAIFGI
jgi:hypothetical protein